MEKRMRKRGGVSASGEKQTGRSAGQSIEGGRIDPTGVRTDGDRYRCDKKAQQQLSEYTENRP